MTYNQAFEKIDAFLAQQRASQPAAMSDELKNVFVLAALKTLLAGVIENNPDAEARFNLFTSNR